ncbi:MAG: glycosyltransferase [Bacillota bacterium]
MRILQVNKYHYPRGGADIFYLDLGERLEAAGHEIAYFSMQHPLNLPTPWSKYFVSRVSFNEKPGKYAYKIPGRTLYSLEAKKRFSRLLDEFRPDIIHFHNIYHHLSPSVILEASRRGIPMLMHAHDYKLVCPNHSLFMDGQPCRRCIPGKFQNCAIHRCVKDSLPGSLLAAVEMHVHHNMMDVYRKHLDRVIAPSRFMKDILVSGGWRPEAINVINNSFHPQTDQRETTDRRYFLIFGRLSPEKGIDTAIKAMSLTQNTKLIIAGEGEMIEDLKALTDKHNLSGRIDFVGQQDKDGVRALICGAKAVIIPSIWYENFPLSALEALSLGTPVIASDIGGLPEIVSEANGVLVPPADSAALASVIQKVQDGDISFNRESIIASSCKYLPEDNTKLMLELYNVLIQTKNSA